MSIDGEELFPVVILNELHTESLYIQDLYDLDNENLNFKQMLSQNETLGSF